MWTRSKPPIHITIPLFPDGFEPYLSSPSRIAIPILAYFTVFVNRFRLNTPNFLQKIFFGQQSVQNQGLGTTIAQMCGIV